MKEWLASLNFDDTFKRVLRDYTEALLIAIIVAVILRVFFVSAYKIPTSSMSPTLKVGDFVLAVKWPYGWKVPFTKGKWLGFTAPKRGDVAVFSCPNNPSSSCVKRVVGLPGDKVEIQGKKLLVNDRVARYEADYENEESVRGQRVVLKERIFSHERTVLIGASMERANFGPIIVPPGHFFVLADSRDTSEDSRLWGEIPMAHLQAKIFLVWLSLDWSDTWHEGGWPQVRWQRIFTTVD